MAMNQARNRLKDMLSKAKFNKQSYQKGKFIEDYLLDMRQHDIMFNARVSIDSKLRVGKWFQINVIHGKIV